MIKFTDITPLFRNSKLWYFILLIITLVIGILFTVHVKNAEDAEMRENLITYGNTIEQSIDWKPFASTLNTKPVDIKLEDLMELNAQLKRACEANKDCHFIYLLYPDKQDVKFLLDSSPQPDSEISHITEIFVEATSALKKVMLSRTPIVEGPITDHWGTWVSARVPVKITANTENFVMLNIDVAAKNWNQRILNKSIIPMIFTLIFIVILLGLIFQNRRTENLLAQLFSSTSELSELANNDALTGLPNRRLLDDRMGQAIKAAKRSKGMVAVMFLDIDHFKAVNDSHGHDVGDQLLKIVADRLSQLLRIDDTIARIGGDEFVVLLPKVMDMLEVREVAEKIISELMRPFYVGDIELHIGGSIGIAFYPKDDSNPKNLIKYADSAMYVAKRQGRNGYAVYSDSFLFAPE